MKANPLVPLLLFGLFAPAGSAAAQSAPGPPSAPSTTPATPPSFLQVRAGPWSFTPLIKLLDLGIDTNVFDTTGTVRQAPDFTTTVQPQIEARLKTSGLDFKATGMAGLVYYAANANQRAINPGVSASIEQRLSSFFLIYGAGAIGFSKDRTEFEVDARTRRLTADVAAGLRFTGRKLELDVQGQRSSIAYDQDARYLGVALSQTLNRTDTAAAGVLSYKLSPFTSMTFNAGITGQRFSNSPDRDINLTRESVGLRFSPRAIIGGFAELGYLRGNTLSARSPDFSGLAPRAGLTYRLFDTTSLAFGAQRDIENSYNVDRPYFVYDLYEASIRQAIAHRFDIGAAAQHTNVTYRRFASASGSAADGSDRATIQTLSASIGIRIGRDARFGGYVERWQRISGSQPYSTVRTGVQFGVGKVNVTPRGVFLNGVGR